MIEKMTKYSFVLLSGDEGEFLRRVEELGLVDITRSSKPVDERSVSLLASSEELRAALTKLEAIDFGEDPDKDLIEAAIHPDASHPDPLGDFKKASQNLDVHLAELSQAQKEVEQRRPWGKFDMASLEALSARGYKVRWYSVPKKSYDPSWAAEYPLAEVFDDGRKVWFVTISDAKDYSLPVEECPAPEGDLGFTLRKVESLKEKIIQDKATLLELKEYVPSMRKTLRADTSELQRHLASAGAQKAADNLVTTFIGFAPEENDDALCKEFDSMSAFYLKEKAKGEDNPPIKFRESRFARMFTVLTDMYGRPEYDEFDPTPYISFFFTLFFAMCMGDAGYGLVLLILGMIMRKSEGSMGKFAPLITTLGAATFVMGIVFHMFFGIDISAASWVPSWLKKCMITGTVAGYDAQMLFSILIGVIHLSVAMVLKAVYSVKKNGLAESLGTLGWTLLLVGGVIVGGFALLGVIGAGLTKWIVIVLGCVSAVGIFLLNDIHRNPLANIGSGLYETYNTVTGLLGDVLSYLRLYALGLAGGMLGSAFNDLGLTVLDLKIPGLNYFFCGLILVFGHVLNLAMCCLGAFVHPLRLNFLEFFKNSGYEGTGRVYSPLGEEIE